LKIALYIAFHNIDKGGIFTYSNTVIRLITKSNSVEKVIIIHSPDQKEMLKKYAADNQKIELIQTRIKDKWITNFLYNFSIALISFSNISAKIPSFFEKIGNAINPFRYLFNRISCDLIHVPFQFSPVYLCNKPIILSMHDLQEFHFPEFFNAYERIERAIRYRMGIEKTKRVIVSFDHIKNDILKYYNVPAERVSVCPIAMSADWSIASESMPAQELRTKYNLPEKFILYPAQTWPHKNHIRLLAALKILNEKEFPVNLICTGHLNSHYKKIKEVMEEYGLNKQVQFLGLVSEQELVGLYKSATLVVIPTLYEAGSGPLYEAMRYLTPVICSTTTSLPDTMNNQLYTFDPLKTEEMAGLIQKMLSDKTFTDQNIENSKRRIQYYSAFDFTAPFVNAYSQALKK